MAFMYYACAILRERKRGGAGPKMVRWTLRRVALLVLRLVKLCATYRLVSTPDQRPKLLTGSKAENVKRHPPSLLQLSQPENWDQLHRDIQQRIHQSDTGSFSPSAEDGSEPSGQSGNSESRDQVLSEEVRSILMNPPWIRTHAEVEQAVVELKACTDFRDYPNAVQHNLCRVGWYIRLAWRNAYVVFICSSLEPGRVIFREQSPACCFYFVISGDVLATGDQVSSQTLTSGSSFGDESIIENSPRTVTCLALTHLELFVISKSDYFDFSLRQSRISYQKTKHLAFCKSVSVLTHWPLHLLEPQSDHCKVAYFKANSVVVKDSSKNPWAYVIMSGSCRVVKRFVYGSEDQRGTTNKIKSYSNPADTSKLALASENITFTKQKPQGLLRQVSQKKNKHPLPLPYGTSDPVQKKGHRFPHSLSTPPVSERQRLPRKQFLLQLQLLKPKDIFGLSSFVYDSEPSVTLVSNGAEVVMLSKEFLHQHFKENMQSKLRHQIPQIPSQETMLKRLRDHCS